MNFLYNTSEIPHYEINEFRNKIINTVSSGGRIAAYFGVPSHQESVKLFVVFSYDNTGKIFIISSSVTKEYLSLTPECTQAHLFEREIFEQCKIHPQTHPWLKPLRFHQDYNQQPLNSEINVSKSDFYKIHGEEVHEVAVGPVHAGIIEPGHFRFQCRGENVLHLEISLGYQYRAIEKNLVGGPHKKTLYQMETIAGDTSIGHTSAYCENLESLAETVIPERAAYLRAITLEIERIANHIGDLGALAGDIGFLPVYAYCGRIRGDFLNHTAFLCGNRFGRNMLLPGGVNFDIDSSDIPEFLSCIKKSYLDAKGAINLLFETPSVLSRFENTGQLSTKDAIDLGLVGPAARACSVKNDVRYNFQNLNKIYTGLPIAIGETGDVYARAMVRWLEIQNSIEFIEDKINKLPSGNIYTELKKLKKDSISISLIEGWRGEICHVAITDKTGKLLTYKIVDPSFHNWAGLSMSMRNQQISDFPLCNKSFNLSYCGHDL